MSRLGLLICLAMVTALSIADASAAKERSQVIIALDGEGKHLAKWRLDNAYPSDLLLSPIYARAEIADGQVTWREIADDHFAISVRLEIAGFGDLWLVADNEGRGYVASPRPLNLMYEVARSRLAQVRQVQRSAAGAGCKLEPSTRERMEKAAAQLRAAEALSASPADCAQLAYRSLQESGPAGEEAVLQEARFRIQRHGYRPEFRFGANAFGWSHGEPYRKRFEELLSFGTVPFYCSSLEPKQGEYEWASRDQITAWLNGAGITAKGHPLVWFYPGITPDWVRKLTFEQLLSWIDQRTRTIVSRYAGKIDIWDIINEAHVQNTLNLTLDQMVQANRVVAKAAREANPKCVRIVNNCCLFAEYMRGRKAGPDLNVCTPYQYLQRIQRARVPYEVIGLQLYYTGRDLLEHARLLDRFCKFGKPVHVTELAVPSSMDADPASFWKDENAVRNMGWWRRPWDEQVQADWIDGFYTICYSRPQVQAITWWDFADYSGHFFPNGGFLRSDFTPKASFDRLKALIASWKELPKH